MPSNKTMFIAIIHELKDNANHLAKIKTLIRLSLAEGFDINTKYIKGRTLGHYIVKYNISGLMVFVAKLGLNLDICDDNYDTPLHIAVKNNRLYIIKELIKAGVDLNMPAEFEATPLHLAVSEGHLDVAKLLIKSGVDVSLVDERNLTALDYAIDEKNDQMINLLKHKK